MKNSTFSAQVANNLLTVLQGYSKTIRLLLVMFLTLTVSANAWAQYTKASSIAVGDVVVLVYETGKKELDGISTTSTKYGIGTSYTTTPTGQYELTVEAGSTSGTYSFKAPNNQYLYWGSGNSLATNATKNANTSWTVTFSSGNAVIKNANDATRQIKWNTSSPRFACYTSGQSAVQLYKKSAASYTVNWTINPAAGGTLSATSGTNTTVTPNVAYTYGSPAYTVTPTGKATVSQDGDNFTATPSANCTIQINMVEKPKYTVTWNVNGEVYETTQVTEGSKPTFPATPSSCDATSNTFYGWATATWDGKINDVSAKTIYTSANNMPAEAATYHAVFCEGGGGSVLINEEFDNTSEADDNNALTSSTFSNFSGETAKAYKSKYGGVKFGSSSAAGYITSKSLDLSTAFTVTLDACKYSSDAGNINVTVGTQTKTISNSSLEEAGTFKTFTLEFDAATSTSTVKIGTSSKRAYIDNVIIATGGEASNFITTCAAGDPCDALQAPIVTATATANSITLSWATVPGATSYNVYNYTTDEGEEVNVLTYTFNGLDPETEYEWGVESVKDECSKETRGTTTTSATPCEQLGAATGLTVETDFVQDGQTYVKFSWTPADNTKTNATSQKICFGKVDEAGTCVDNLAKNLTWTGDLKSKLEPGEYWWSIQALGDGVNYCDGDVVNGTNFTIEAPTYTVTFNAGSGTCGTESLTETSGGAGVTLPTAYPPATCATDGWTFAGWWTGSVAETTTSPGELLTADSNYKPASDCTLYAVYSYTEAGGGGGSQTVTLTNDDIVAAFVGSGDNKTTSYGNHTIVSASGTWGGLITIGNYSDVKYVGISADNENRHLASPIFSANITNITIRGRHNASKTRNIYICSSNTTAKPTSGDIGSGSIASSGVSSQYTNWTDVSIPVSEDYKNFYVYADGGLQIYSIVVTTSGGSTTTYNSNPTCDICANILTISKGTETNGTFTLDISGNIETCETEVSVVVEPAPANHYHIGSVTATAPTTGGAPTVIDNDNGTYTITYAANSTGTSTINVTFAEDAKATIKLYELGVLTTITTEYVGDKYTLPSTSSQSCGTKTLVGWSTIAFAETDTRPTENYYGISTQITLAETQTFYAVFAQSNGGGGGNGDYARVTAALDDWSGDYLIAYNDQTFANGSTGGTSGMGANGNKQDLSSHINNNTIPANIGDLYNVTLVTVDGGYVLQTKDNKYNYQSSNANGLALTDNIETAKQYPLTVTFNNENDIAIAHSHGAIFHYNKNQAGYFRFYQDGGQESVYLYKRSGTAATYTGYTTSCAVITGIEVDNPKTEFNQYDEFVFDGTVYAVDEIGNRIDVTTSATFSGYDMKKDGKDTVTVTYLTHSTTYEITIKKVNAYALTWNVSGATNTGLSPAYVIPGNAIGKLPNPKAIPDGCEGKTFVGWTESNTVNSDGTEITFITSSTVPTQNTTYYAVFATPSGNAGDGDYVKVTEDANDFSGEYLIVYEGDTENSYAGAKAFDGGLGTLDAASNTISVTIDDNTIASTSTTDAAKFTITKNGDAYIITSASNYHIGQTSDANGLLSSTSTSYTNTITFTEGNVDVVGSGDAHLRYNKDAGQTRFRYYKSTTYTGQQPIALYKKSGSSASYTDYTTGCQDVTITYYGFTGGYTTNCGGSDLNRITQRVNSEHTIPNCGNITDPTTLGRTFLNLWKDQNGKEHKPGDSFIVTQDTTLYAQWKLETTGDIELPADKDDLATTDIIVTGGKTLTIPEGETITINSLTLKGGLLGKDSKSGYAMPSVVIPDDATLVRKNTTINLDLVVNSDSWYPFAVPFAATNNTNVEYLDPTLAAASEYGTHFAIKTYDGARRAEEGVDQANNWVQLKRNEKLQPGVGYIISAMTKKDKGTATIRIPMTVPNEWLANGEQKTVNEVTRNEITVIAYTGKASDSNNGGHQRHAGWNFVANPYLSNFAGSEASNEDGSFINGEITINNGDYSYGGENVPYVTIPTYNFAHYYQVKLSDATLSPAYSFFVQVCESGTMTFDVAGRQAAPASIAARNAEERPVKMDVDITLSDNHSSDQTGIIISDRYSDAYEIGRDLEKLFGSAYNLSVYTLMADNTPLAFQALAIRSNMQVIPVGYRTPAQGEYTFRLNEATSSIDLLNEQYEQLVLVDYQTGELTNLLIADYTFYSERTQADNRFAIYAVPRQNAPTDLPNAIGQDKQAQKILHNGHLYILRDGNVYNGNGQIVK